MGGELLADIISDEIFLAYEKLLYDIEYNLKEKYNLKCKYNIVTNGIYTNLFRIIELCKKFNIRLIMSYDPIDRFNTIEQKKLWFKNYEIFKSNFINIAISILLTKRNIKAYIEGDKLFDKINNTDYIDSNIYVPRITYQEHLVNDDDLFEFYKFCIDKNYFNISDIYNILSHLYICKQEFYFMFGKSIKNHLSDCLEGLPFSKKIYYGENYEKINDDTDCLGCKEKLGILKRGCYYCKYYNDCSEMCWTQILFKDYKITECPIKRIYDYIKEKPEIIQNFKFWKEKNSIEF